MLQIFYLAIDLVVKIERKSNKMLPSQRVLECTGNYSTFSMNFVNKVLLEIDLFSMFLLSFLRRKCGGETQYLCFVLRGKASIQFAGFRF